MLVELLGRIMASSPRMKRGLWRVWYQFLARRYRQPDWTFMNYGYADPDSPGIELKPEDEGDRYCIQLYAHVVSAANLRGKHVVEVGCGRGGGCSFMARYLEPESVAGIDLAQSAVDLCRKLYRIPNLEFRQGDCAKLPLEDASVDAVVNVESSHCYPDMAGFLAEVRRILKPGGFFLWADFRAVGELDSVRAQLRDSGLAPVHERSITKNVIHALDLSSESKRKMIERMAPRFLRGHFRDFAAVKDSKVYEAFRSGELEYLSCVLQVG